MNHNPTLVDVLRGGTVESVHAGAIAVVDGDGALVTSIGDIDRPIFPRSAVKLLQALPLVASGAADRLGLADEELALACASHNGEARHVASAAAMLAKAGVDASVLECGAHWPYDEAASRSLAAHAAAPTALNNNCSGKHSGFVCLACLMSEASGSPAQAAGAGSASGGDLRRYVAGYVNAAHPVMREVTAALEVATGCDLSRAPVGTDGCSIPTYAVPLRALAHAFARVGTGVGLSRERATAAHRLRRAVAAAPFMVAGSGRFDTRMIERLGERVYLKVGAEGVFCAAFPDRGVGVAIKVDDGHARAAEVVMASVVDALVKLDDRDATFVRSLMQPVMTNWNGIEVGSLRPADALRQWATRMGGA